MKTPIGNSTARMEEPKKRKTLSDLEDMTPPTPDELYDELIANRNAIMATPGAAYKTNREEYLARDVALCAILYNAELRISEALRLKKRDFQYKEGCLKAENILLSKHKPGARRTRNIRLPLKGPRAKFTKLIEEYLDALEPEDRLFPWSLNVGVYHTGRFYTRKKDNKRLEVMAYRMTGTARAYRIVKTLLPNYTEHWLRAFGDSYLYDVRDHDILAVADETKQDARTLQKYIRAQASKYPAA
jgi:integrase